MGGYPLDSTHRLNTLKTPKRAQKKKHKRPIDAFAYLYNIHQPHHTDSTHPCIFPSPPPTTPHTHTYVFSWQTFDQKSKDLQVTWLVINPFLAFPCLSRRYLLGARQSLFVVRAQSQSRRLCFGKVHSMVRYGNTGLGEYGMVRYEDLQTPRVGGGLVWICTFTL